MGRYYNNMSKNMNSMDYIKVNPQYKKETIVISDLHGKADKWEWVRQKLISNPNLNVIILGDAMDRQEYGLEILLEIQQLSEYGRVQYLPGNHDVFAYNYVKAKNRNQRIYEVAKKNLERNGGNVTMQKLENFDKVVWEEMKSGRIQRPVNLDEFINWLGRQPIQKITRENNTNYALAHAMFDTELYNFNRNFCLEDALNIQLQNSSSNILKRFNNVMWYREKDTRTHYAPISWPKDYVVVVGHTPQTSVNVQNIEQNPERPIVYVDCGKGDLQGFNLTIGKHEAIEPGTIKNNLRTQDNKTWR